MMIMYRSVYPFFHRLAIYPSTHASHSLIHSSSPMSQRTSFDTSSGYLVQYSRAKTAPQSWAMSTKGLEGVTPIDRQTGG